ncbi:MAG: ABC-F family ATP-binding cassette domain-containing protein [Anaerolineae bacterium]
MLIVSGLSKRYGDQWIFRDVSLTVNPGERVGLVGPNGCGKTTLLRVIVGEEPPTGGSVAFVPASLRVGYLAQGLEPSPGATVRDLVDPHARRLATLEARLERLGARLADDAENPAASEAYSAVLAEIERVSAAHRPGRSDAILAGLDLADLDRDMPAALLSGGQKTRLGLARVLNGDPQLLLLDEPTNHLDIDALEWLEAWLAAFDGAALIVSHDRTFMDRTVNRIVALDPENMTAASYTGNYTDYIDAVVSARAKQWSQYRDQVTEIARLRRDAERTMARAVRKENALKDSKQRRYAKKVARRAKAKERRLERYLADDARVAKPGLTWQMKLDLEAVDAGGRDVLALEDLAVGYDAGAPLLRDINLALRAGARVALLGPNGSGKTTLLRTIVGELAPLAGRARLGASVRAGYAAQEQETLDPDAHALSTVLEAAPMPETDARSFLHHFLFSGDEVFIPVRDLSYGERARLMLARMVAQGCNLLILDEPINHLDVPSRERFEQAMAAYDGTVLAVVHDRYFIDRFATEVWRVERGTVSRHVAQADRRARLSAAKRATFG